MEKAIITGKFVKPAKPLPVPTTAKQYIYTISAEEAALRKFVKDNPK
jgi:hypothetical protein